MFEVEEGGGEDAEEGPAIQRGRVLAIGGSVTYRPSRMTCEGQTSVVCADVEVCDFGPAVDDAGSEAKGGGGVWEQVYPMAVARDGCAAAVSGGRV